MQLALCNATAEDEDADHMHICNLDHGHKGKSHACKCGTFFLSIKQSEIDRELKKTVQ